MEIYKKPEIPTRFLSEDPYTVLGVLKEATLEEAKKAYWKLMKQYHPDKNLDDQVATEITKLVNLAYESVTGGVGVEAKEIEEWLRTTFFKALKAGSKEFSKYILDIKSKSMAFTEKYKTTTEKAIDNLLNTSEARKILNDDFKFRFRDGIYTAQRYSEYIKEWENISDVKINIKDCLDLSAMKLFIKSIAFHKIRFLKKEDFDFDSSEFLKFVTEWQTAGVNLKEIINCDQVQKYLTRVVGFKYKQIIPFLGTGKIAVTNFISSFKRVGWTPNKEVDIILKKSQC